MPWRLRPLAEAGTFRLTFPARLGFLFLYFFFYGRQFRTIGIV